MIAGYGIAASAPRSRLPAPAPRSSYSSGPAGGAVRPRWRADHLHGWRHPRCRRHSVRGHPREHEDVHDGGTRARRRRSEDHRILRGQRRPLQLAGRLRRPFKESFYGQPGWETPFDDGLMYSGGENSAPFNTIATPAPRGHIPQMADKKVGEKGGGYMHHEAAGRDGRETRGASPVRHAGQTLVTDATGRVVECRPSVRKDVVGARRKGVVLATGSFAYNKDMVEAFAPRLIGRPAPRSRSTTAGRSGWRRPSAPTWRTWTLRGRLLR